MDLVYVRKSRLVGWGLALAVLGGCPGDDSAASDGQETGSVTSTGGTTQTQASSSGSDGSEASSSGGGTTGDSTSMGDTTEGETGPGGMCETEPTEVIASRVEISVELVNDTDETFYVVDTAEGCTSYGIERDGTERSIAVGFHCGCECPSPPPPVITTLAIEPRQSHTLTWDGRVLSHFNRMMLCQEEGFEDSCSSDGDGSLQPLESGPTTMRIPLYTAEPPMPDAGQYGLLDACPGDGSLNVNFELGEADQALTVMLSTVGRNPA